VQRGRAVVLVGSLVAAAAGVGAGACAIGPIPGPRPDDAAFSYGHNAEGMLFGGTRLPDRGLGFVRARGDDTRWGTPVLVGALERAAAAVARDFPGTIAMKIGDLSARFGGRHPRHRSHRSGRDADLIYYVTDASGRSVAGSGTFNFIRSGFSRVTERANAPGGDDISDEGGPATAEGAPTSNGTEAPAPPVGGARTARAGDLVFFDDARNWHFIRTLLLDPEANAQFVFCAWSIKQRLLEYATAHETSAEAIYRASFVLLQPSDGRPHSDHMHIRVACSAQDRALGCVDRGPLWPWLRKELEKPAGPSAPPPLDDEALVAALFDDSPGDEPPARASETRPGSPR